MKGIFEKNTVFFIICILFFRFGSVCAQNTKSAIIFGKITDGGTPTQDALAFANVGIPALNLGASTELDGTFRIVGIPVGTHKLVISYVGYDNYEAEIVLGAGQTLEFNHIIQPSAGVKLEEVVVSAQSIGQRAAINEQIKSNTIVNVISREKLQELPDQNAAESLGRLSGVALQRDGGEGTKVSVRGLSPRFVSVTVNGERIPSTDANDRSVDLAMISPEMLGELRFLRLCAPIWREMP